MAKPVIVTTVSSSINIAVNTEYSLSVTITGATTAWAEGDLFTDGNFSHDWDGSGTLKIKGKSTALQSGITCDIKAKNADGTTTKSTVFNIVPAAPVITTAGLTNIPIYKGQKFSLLVPISNDPTFVDVDAPYLGLTDDKHEAGVLISGDVPSADRFGLTTGRFKVTAGNAAAHVQTSESQLTFAVKTGTPPQITNPSLAKSGTTLTLSFTAPTGALAYEYTLERGDTATWTRFTGTKTNNTVTHTMTVPSNFSLTNGDFIRLRVASPWVGSELGPPGKPTIVGYASSGISIARYVLWTVGTGGPFDTSDDAYAHSYWANGTETAPAHSSVTNHSVSGQYRGLFLVNNGGVHLKSIEIWLKNDLGSSQRSAKKAYP